MCVLYWCHFAGACIHLVYHYSMALKVCILPFIGLVSSSGKLWREQQNFAHSVLKDFGMGRPMLEDKIHDGLSLMLTELENLNLSEVDIHHLLILTVANVLHNIVIGIKYDYSDPFFNYVVSVYEHCFKTLASSGAVNFFPKLLYLPGDLFGIKKILKDTNYLHGIYRKICNEHWNSLDLHHDRDFIDTYLKRILQNKANHENTTLSSKNHCFSFRRIVLKVIL